MGTIAASAEFRFAERGIAVIGPVPGGLPSIGLPDVTWSETLELLPVAASCFVMIIAQSAATSRVFGVRYRERVDEDADILGLSVANAAAAVTGTFVVNGSPTQTAMADRAGARSQVAQLVFAGIVLLVLLVLTGPLQYLPRCVLASIVFTIAVGMIDVKGLRDIRRESPGEFYLAVFTAAAVVAIGVEQGILLAIALSLFRHVRHSYRPHTMMLAPDATGRWIPVPATLGKETEPGLIVYRFDADLFMQTSITLPTKCAASSNARRTRCAGSSSMRARLRISTILAATPIPDLSMKLPPPRAVRVFAGDPPTCGPKGPAPPPRPATPHPSRPSTTPPHPSGGGGGGRPPAERGTRRPPPPGEKHPKKITL